jgi:glycosyltransferase involved in cell wall biosynthesis
LLTSLERQTFRNFEVIIADDGSADESEKISQQKRSFPMRFVTQPDQGYRKAKILNQALKQARADYLVFLDGDVILEPHFLADHLRLRKVRHFVCGRRVELGPEFSQKITEKDVTDGKFDHVTWALLVSAFKKDTTTVKRAFRVAPPLLRRLLGYHRELDLLGSNFSAWKRDVEAVNGFNEAQESYWGEDGDLYVRFTHSGLHGIGAKAMCIQYHVFHKRRVASGENEERYQQLLKNPEYKWAKQGLKEAD